MTLRPVPPVPSEPEDDGGGVNIRALQDRLRQVERDLKRAGDPSAEMFGAMSDQAGEMFAQRQAVERLVERLDEQTKHPAETLTEAQVHTLGRHLVAGCAAWAPRLRKSLDWRTSTILACALIGAMLIGGIIDRQVLRAPLRSIDIGTMKCQEERGGRFCFVWVEQPTQQAPVAPPTKGMH